MALKYHIEIEWISDIPSSNDLFILNTILSQIYYDVPILTDKGMMDQWREPFNNLQSTLAILHVYGYPCRGRQTYRVCGDAAITWILSEPNLSELEIYEIQILRKITNKYDIYFERLIPLL